MNNKTVDINQHILSLNGLSDDTLSFLEKAIPQKVDHLKVVVS